MNRRRRGRQATRLVLSLMVFYFVLFAFIYLAYSFEWTGLSGQTTTKEIRHYDDNGNITETVQEEQRTPPKTLWDYFAIVAAPAAATVAAYFTTSFQRRRSEDDAFQAYTSQIGDLLSEGKLRKPQDGANDANIARTLAFARARTLTVLEESSSALKRKLLMFLRDAGLINGNQPLIDLSGADLTDANLSGLDLSTVNLSGADLRGARLVQSRLGEANLRGTDLSGAYLRGAHLNRADLTNADLRDARGVTDEGLADARTLHGTTMPDGSTHD